MCSAVLSSIFLFSCLLSSGHQSRSDLLGRSGRHRCSEVMCSVLQGYILFFIPHTGHTPRFKRFLCCSWLSGVVFYRFLSRCFLLRLNRCVCPVVFCVLFFCYVLIVSDPLCVKGVLEGTVLFCFVMFCFVMFCFVMFCLVLSCFKSPCPLKRLLLPCTVLCCSVTLFCSFVMILNVLYSQG